MATQTLLTYGAPGAVGADTAGSPSTVVLRDSTSPLGGTALGPSSIAGLAEIGPKTVGASGVIAVTTTYTVLSPDLIVKANAAGGAFTVNLPAAAASTGRIVTVVRTSASNSVTVDGNAAETINGAATYVLSSQYAVARLFCDGTEWFLL